MSPPEDAGAAPPPEPTEISKPQAGEKYSVQDLLNNSRSLCDVPRHVLAGALHGDEREEMTAAQAKKLVKDFADRPGAPVEEDDEE